MIDLVIRHAQLMTCDPDRAPARDPSTCPELGMLDNAAVAIADGKVAWIGDDGAHPPGELELDAGGRLVTPGLVDCHTHAVFAGDRAHEFALRASGADYLAIAAAGGGIAASLIPTRAASDDELVESLIGRLATAAASGTTVVEVKTGYDLTCAGELRLLRVIARAAELVPVRVVPTLLAHVIPPERKADRDAFVREIVEQWVPGAAGHATSVDVYCDDGAFTLAEATAIWRAAVQHGLGIRGHVGQFADLGAAEVLAELGARSADHVEQLSAGAIAALARANVVAVMLPGACVQLRMAPPPVAALRAAGVRMAIASDFNPGTSHCESLLPQLWLATTHYGMTVEEAWLGVTRHAATALAIEAGVLRVGARADAIVWNATTAAEIPYKYGGGRDLVRHAVFAGRA
jgi:imidazolonepropionase